MIIVMIIKAKIKSKEMEIQSICWALYFFLSKVNQNHRPTRLLLDPSSCLFHLYGPVFLAVKLDSVSVVLVLL